MGGEWSTGDLRALPATCGGAEITIVGEVQHLTRDEQRELGTWLLLRSMPEPEPGDAEGDLWAELIEVMEGCYEPLTGSGGRRVLALLIAGMRQRRAFGVAKYGKPLTLDNGRDHLRDLLDEALDAIVYAYAAAEGDSSDHLVEMSMKLALVARKRMEER